MTCTNCGKVTRRPLQVYCDHRCEAEHRDFCMRVAAFMHSPEYEKLESEGYTEQEKGAYITMKYA